jgi:hypothetical protein
MPGHRAAAAGAHVGGGAGDGAGGCEAAEQRRGGWPALGDELLVGVVAVLDGRIGDPRRQQRFDGAEQGDGEGRRDQLAQGFQG